LEINSKYYHYISDSNPPFQEVVANATTEGLVVGGEMSMDMNKIPFCQDPSQDVLADDLIIKALGGGPSAIGNNQDVTAVGGKKKKNCNQLEESQSIYGRRDRQYISQGVH
jgi:hypothetical protein